MDFLSSLPAISLLNGSVVTDSEREDAERFFIRYHVEFPEKELPFRSAADMVTREVLFFFCLYSHLSILPPHRYHSLVTKYGKLEPLAEIDLRPRWRAQVEVHCEGKVEQVSWN